MEVQSVGTTVLQSKITDEITLSFCGNFEDAVKLICKVFLLKHQDEVFMNDADFNCNNDACVQQYFCFSLSELNHV